MSGISKTGDDSSVHRAEDVKYDVEPDLKHDAVHAKDGDRAAELIGNQHIELTEEDVSDDPQCLTPYSSCCADTVESFVAHAFVPSRTSGSVARPTVTFSRFLSGKHLP